MNTTDGCPATRVSTRTFHRDSRPLSHPFHLPPPAPPFPPHASRAAAVWLSAAFWLLQPAAAAAQARIDWLHPDKGPARGGTAVLIEVNENLILGPVRVEFGGRPSSQVRRLGLSILEVITPPGEPGPVPVRVVYGLWGSSTAPAVFTYLPLAPQLTRLHPPSVSTGSDGLVLEVEGEHFTTTSRLRVGDVPVPTTLISAQRLQARIPAVLLASARSVDIRATETAVGGGTSNALPLAIANPPPQVAGVEAPPLRAGGPGTTLIVRGRDFRSDSRVHLAGTPLPTEFRTGEELAAVIPTELLAKPGDLPVTVVTPEPGGGQSKAVRLSVPPPFPGRYLAFTSNRRGGRNHIFLFDREMGRLDPLEEANSPSASEGYPSISADGRFIVFQSDRNRGQNDIFLFDRQTRRLDLLPELNHPMAFDGFPHISADGRFIVFESDRLNGRPKIFLFDRHTRALSELTQANEATADDGLASISD